MSLDSNDWTPRTLEDRLLARYLAEHPGELFLEVNVGGRSESHGPRRLDGLLIPGEQSRVHAQDSYRVEDVAEAIDGAAVHVLEAKWTLNRNVVGQVEVGSALLRRDFNPAEIEQVAVCADDNVDLQWYCEERGIRAVIYEEISRPGRNAGVRADGRLDVRSPPDPARQRAFRKGWDAAVRGKLFGSVKRKKTHMNMGNLFGWIYGDKSEQFRMATWSRYVGSMTDDEGDPAGEA